VPTDAGPVAAGFGTIAASPSALYFTTYVDQNDGVSLALGGSLMSIPLGGGAPTQVASGLGFKKPFMTATGAIVGETLLNQGGDSIIFVPFSGGAPTTIVALADGNILGNGMATDGTFVYYGEIGGQGSVQASQIDADGADAGPVTIVPGTFPNPSPDVIGVFGQRLMFIYPQGQIESVALPPQANSPVTTLGTAMPGPEDLVPCGTDACWLALGNGIDEINPLDGGAIQVHSLISAVAHQWDYAFDGTSFYVIGSDSSSSPTVQSLAMVPFDGGSPVDGHLNVLASARDCRDSAARNGVVVEVARGSRAAAGCIASGSGEGSEA